MLQPKGTVPTGTQHSQADSIRRDPGSACTARQSRGLFFNSEGSKAQAPFHLVPTESHVCSQSKEPNRTARYEHKKRNPIEPSLYGITTVRHLLRAAHTEATPGYHDPYVRYTNVHVCCTGTTRTVRCSDTAAAVADQVPTCTE